MSDYTTMHGLLKELSVLSVQKLDLIAENTSIIRNITHTASAENIIKDNMHLYNIMCEEEKNILKTLSGLI